MPFLTTAWRVVSLASAALEAERRSSWCWSVEKGEEREGVGNGEGKREKER